MYQTKTVLLEQEERGRSDRSEATEDINPLSSRSYAIIQKRDSEVPIIQKRDGETPSAPQLVTQVHELRTTCILVLPKTAPVACKCPAGQGAQLLQRRVEAVATGGSRAFYYLLSNIFRQIISIYLPSLSHNESESPVLAAD